MNNDKTKIPNIDKNEVTIGDCFEFNQKDDLMSGENQIYCVLC